MSKMYLHKTALLSSSCVMALAGSASLAQESGAHVHGLATLMLAYEGRELEISIESPAANLVGFEYQAKTEEEQNAVNRAKKILSSPESVISFAGAACTLSSNSVDLGNLLAESAELHKHNDHHDEHDEHDEHAHEHHKGAQDHEKHESHSEITVHYRYSCGDLKTLSSVKVNLFQAFPALEEIEAVWVTDQGQGAAELSASNAVIKLK